MTERQKERAFVKDLLRREESSLGQDLQAQVLKSEQNEKCVRCALMIVFVLGLLSLAGLGYSAVLLPTFFENSTPFLVRLFTALALACGLCLLLYVGLWLSYRANTNHLLNEVRRFLLATKESRPHTGHTTFISVQKLDSQVIRLQTPESSTGDQKVQISKVS
ncbi:MAG: hypothetical protein JWM16_6033 [Verrucomicrobiales bacterium]|nr:hypothetical protein [Verrucomicrobiales bacterium]